jgi:hypothetical protein
MKAVAKEGGYEPPRTDRDTREPRRSSVRAVRTTRAQRIGITG